MVRGGVGGNGVIENGRLAYRGREETAVSEGEQQLQATAVQVNQAGLGQRRWGNGRSQQQLRGGRVWGENGRLARRDDGETAVSEVYLTATGHGRAGRPGGPGRSGVRERPFVTSDSRSEGLMGKRPSGTEM